MRIDACNSSCVLSSPESYFYIAVFSEWRRKGNGGTCLTLEACVCLSQVVREFFRKRCVITRRPLLDLRTLFERSSGASEGVGISLSVLRLLI